MFGYIRPRVPEMRVREYQYYRAVYCGLCRTVARRVSPFASLGLSYDYVFLALVRGALRGETFRLTARRCLVHPLHKRETADENEALRDAAGIGTVLDYYALRDRAEDEKGLRGFAAKVLLPFFRGRMNRAIRCGYVSRELADTVSACLGEQVRLEREQTVSPDAAAEPTARMLSCVFSCGFTEAEEKIAAQLGRSVGRFLYFCDAADDVYKDEKRGSYNPFLCSARIEQKGIRIWMEENRARLGSAMRLNLAAANSAFALCDAERTDPTLAAVAENILTLGGSAVAERVLTHPGGGSRSPEKTKVKETEKHD